jgi:hypothetical protein
VFVSKLCMNVEQSTKKRCKKSKTTVDCSSFSALFDLDFGMVGLPTPSSGAAMFDSSNRLMSDHMVGPDRGVVASSRRRKSLKLNLSIQECFLCFV